MGVHISSVSNPQHFKMRFDYIEHKIVFLFLNGLLYNVLGDTSDDLPWLIEGPISSNEINHDVPLDALPEYDLTIDDHESLEIRPIIENIVIKSNITNRVDRTSVNFLVKNPSIRMTKEVAFSIELPNSNYKTTNLSLQILGDDRIYKRAKLEEGTEIHYEKLLARKQAGMLLYNLEKATPKSFNEAKMISIKAIVPSEEKLFITLEYEGPLINLGNGSWSHTVHINPHQLVRNFRVSIDINDTVPIGNVQALELRNDIPVFGYSESKVKHVNRSRVCHVEFYPNENKREAGSGFDMNGQFYTSYSRNKTFLLSKIGDDIIDIASLPQFVNVFDGVITAIDFMFHMLLMVPFIILTEVISAFYVIASEIFGLNTDWYLKEKRWYEKEMDYELDHLDQVFENMDKHFEDFDGTFNFHLESNQPLILSNWKSNPFSKLSVFEDTFDKLGKEDDESKPTSSIPLKRNDFFTDFNSLQKLPKIINWKSSHSGSFSFHS